MPRILLIGSSVDEVAELEGYLAAAGYDVSVATTGREGLRQARDARPELVLLDLDVGDMAGTEVARALRGDGRLRRVALIMVSERAEEIDRVVAFEVGADDFLGKPFSHRELVLRIRAILRRQRPPEAPPEAGLVGVGGLALDPAGHRVRVGDEEVSLSALEFRLLTTLYRRRNRVQTRGALLEEVWGGGTGVSSRTVDACVKRLRQKLGAAGRLVRTVRGVGYRLVGNDEGAA